MNTTTFSSYFRQGLAVLTALPLALAPVRAQDGGAGGLLRKFFEGLGSTLSDDQKEELNRALEKFQQEMSKDDSRQPRSYEWRWEYRSDDNAQGGDNRRQRSQPDTRSRQNDSRRRGRVEPADEQDRFNQLRNQLQRNFPWFDFEQFFDDDFFGPLFREMERLPRERGPGQARPWFQQRENASRNRSSRYEKDSRRVMAEFRPVVEGARESVVFVYGPSGRQLALATIVTEDGYALSKASVLGKGEGLEVEFHDGRIAKAEVVDTAKGYDIALLKIDARNLRPIQWADDEPAPVGTLLAAASPNEDPLAIGVVSVLPRNLDSSKKGFLGVAMDGVPEGVKISEVTPNSAAEKAGLKKGDIITAIDGKPIRTPRELTDYITSKKAEDEVHIGFRRDNEDKVTVATLRSRDDRFEGTTINGERLTETDLKRMQRESDQTARMGVRGNEVADGFPSAMQNDLNLSSNECGGPALDLDGKAVGLNIARAERTKSYAIPAADVKQLLTTVKEGKLYQPRDTTDLKRDAREAMEEIETLKAKLREAEERQRKALEELEKRR